MELDEMKWDMSCVYIPIDSFVADVICFFCATNMELQNRCCSRGMNHGIIDLGVQAGGGKKRYTHGYTPNCYIQ